MFGYFFWFDFIFIGMKKFLVCLFSFVLVFSLTGCKTKDELSEISLFLSNYNISLELNDDMTASASLTLDYINSYETALDEIKFHLYPQFFKEGATDCVVSRTKLNDAYPNGMSYAEFEVTRVQVENIDSQIVYNEEYNSILNVELNNTLLPNERIEIIIDYTFSLPNCEHRFGYGENTINIANFYPIACVYENGEFNVSPYNSNGDPFYSELSNYNVTISANSDLIVAGTGENISENVSNNKKTTTFKAIAVRDFALVLSDKFLVVDEIVDDTTISYYYFDDENAELNLKAGVDAIKTFSSLFGDYPYKTFSIVKTDFVYGGMEYPNLIMISADVSDPDDYKNVIVHETAHQWWYGMVGNDEFLYPWLDEALTEYSSILFYDYNEGYNFSHSQMVSACKDNYSLFITVYEDVLGTMDTSMRAINLYDTEPEYTYCTYVKGVLMYDSLYHVVGEKKFLSSIKTYFENNKFKNATPNDLISAFESECDVELGNFFSSWLDGKVTIR